LSERHVNGFLQVSNQLGVSDEIAIPAAMVQFAANFLKLRAHGLPPVSDTSYYDKVPRHLSGQEDARFSTDAEDRLRRSEYQFSAASQSIRPGLGFDEGQAASVGFWGFEWNYETIQRE
jgi:hypothetical protein